MRQPFDLTPVLDADGFTDADNEQLSRYWLHDELHDCCKKFLDQKGVLTFGAGK